MAKKRQNTVVWQIIKCCRCFSEGHFLCFNANTYNFLLSHFPFSTMFPISYAPPHTLTIVHHQNPPIHHPAKWNQENSSSPSDIYINPANLHTTTITEVSTKKYGFL